MGCGSSAQVVEPNASALSVVFVFVHEDTDSILLNKDGSLFTHVVDNNWDAAQQGFDEKSARFKEVLNSYWGWKNANATIAQDQSVLPGVKTAATSLEKIFKNRQPCLLFETPIQVKKNTFLCFVESLTDKHDGDTAIIAELAKIGTWVNYKKDPAVLAKIYETYGTSTEVNQWVETLINFGVRESHPLDAGLYIVFFKLRLAGANLNLMMSSDKATLLPSFKLSDTTGEYDKAYFKAIEDEANNNDTPLAADEIKTRGLEEPKLATLRTLLTNGLTELRTELKDDGKKITLKSVVGPLSVNDQTQVVVVMDGGSKKGEKQEFEKNLVATDIHKFNMFHTHVHAPKLQNANKATNKPPMPSWIVSVLKSNLSPTATGNRRSKRGKPKVKTSKDKYAAFKKAREAEEAKRTAVKLAERKAAFQASQKKQEATEKALGEFVMNKFASLSPAELKVAMADMHDPLNQLNASFALDVGEVFPADEIDYSEIVDCFGESFNLADEFKKGPTVLLFYRGEWCPFCNMTLNSYSGAMDEFNARGVQVIAVSAEEPDETFTIAEKLQLRFKCVSDPNFGLIRPMGLAMKMNNTMFGDVDLKKYFHTDDNVDHISVPIPATYVFDTNGKVVYKLVDLNVGNRGLPNHVLPVLDKLTGYVAPGDDVASEETAPAVE